MTQFKSRQFKGRFSEVSRMAFCVLEVPRVCVVGKFVLLDFVLNRCVIGTMVIFIISVSRDERT